MSPRGSVCVPGSGRGLRGQDRCGTCPSSGLLSWGWMAKPSPGVWWVRGPVSDVAGDRELTPSTRGRRGFWGRGEGSAQDSPETSSWPQSTACAGRP